MALLIHANTVQRNRQNNQCRTNVAMFDSTVLTFSIFALIRIVNVQYGVGYIRGGAMFRQTFVILHPDVRRVEVDLEDADGQLGRRLL